MSEEMKLPNPQRKLVRGADKSKGRQSKAPPSFLSYHRREVYLCEFDGTEVVVREFGECKRLEEGGCFGRYRYSTRDERKQGKRKLDDEGGKTCVKLFGDDIESVNLIIRNEEVKFVVEDSSSVEEGSERSKTDNCLILSPEETFYLSHSLTCLLVQDTRTTDGGEVFLTNTQLWREFRALDLMFPWRYATYQLFRNKEWVVQNAVRYGADYLLYKQGPSYYHSTYAVLVVAIDKSHPSHLTTNTLACLNRVLETVNKNLIISYVSSPDTLELEDLSKFEVTEVLVRRWIPGASNNL